MKNLSTKKLTEIKRLALNTEALRKLTRREQTDIVMGPTRTCTAASACGGCY
jgi:hypothetical protein